MRASPRRCGRSEEDPLALPEVLSGDTIAAIATPAGAGGIGIVRLSGPQAGQVLRTLFRHSSRDPLQSPRRLCLGQVVDPATGHAVDEVLAVYMPGPGTFTREPVVEIDTHGGGLVLREVLRLCLRAGARAAQPGEFTLRAFLNGRIDLAQAEAVRDLVSARTHLAGRQALAQLEGALSDRVRRTRGSLLDALAGVEAAIDFDETVDYDAVAELLHGAEDELRALVKSAREGIRRREGLRVTIVGRPNVGKSSLLNSLLRNDRAIVTDIPGTTRDTLEESVDLAGLAITFVDTAGLGAEAGDDPVERLGRERSWRALRGADMALLVLDASRPLDDGDRAVAEGAASAPLMLAVWNKIDLGPPREPGPLAGCPEVHVSALTGAGMERLEASIVSLVLQGDRGEDEAPLTSERHLDAARRALEAASAAREGLADGYRLDMAAEDLRGACRALGEITGESVDADLLTRLFATFCVGK